MVMVGGRIATPEELDLHRADVNDALGVTGSHGFSFSVTGMGVGESVELYVLTPRGLTLVACGVVTGARIEESFFAQLAVAKAICDQDDAVAISCWDGAHNPVGRAKALYDVAQSQRPTLLVTYLSEDFGGKIWAPLRDTSIAILTIPWRRRAIYHRALAAASIKFNTVWICKPRLPSFLLTQQIAAHDAKLILDFDDNEDHFSRSPGSREKPYGLTTINLAQRLASTIPARTAASVTLTMEMSAHLVRHARSRSARQEKPEASNVLKIGFIGTVRGHKNILEAARAVRLFAWKSGRSIEFHVYGDVKPDVLKGDLEANGAIVIQHVSMSKLYEQLRAMDVVLTGYPSPKEQEITRYQISSKIGDALAVGRPVLVPMSPSTMDLKETPGIYLFDEGTFGRALALALDANEDFELPAAFTLEGAYEAFQAAENQANQEIKASRALSLLPVVANDVFDKEKSLLLIWKQHDAGLYGRRVDQIARAYKTANPDAKVTILEFIHTSTISAYQENVDSYVSEQSVLLQMADIKSTVGLDDDGTVIRQIRYDSSSKLSGLVESFLIDNEMSPVRTTVILFPIINFYEKLIGLLEPFTKIVDIVDNQFSWVGKNPVKTKLFQYTLMCRSADLVVFNSEANREFFLRERILKDGCPVAVIPNWYVPPKDVVFDFSLQPNRVNILYSGNMNDRIDWNLFRKIANLNGNLTIHLVGTANVNKPDFISLCELPNVIYHGPLQERQTLSLLQTIDVTVMPHLSDDVSAYMNPLKVHMYAAAGVITVSTNVAGLNEGPMLRVAKNHDEFLDILSGLVFGPKLMRAKSKVAEAAVDYVSCIKNLA